MKRLWTRKLVASVVGVTGMKAQKTINESKPKKGEGVVKEREVLEVCFCPIIKYIVILVSGRDAIRAWCAVCTRVRKSNAGACGTKGVEDCCNCYSKIHMLIAMLLLHLC